ncbi:DoxX family protein [Nocardia yunnanensis]|uniref:DoxX family protein n=1 Tax=Nocardia yunnanensis TaxID=2382165 RepID=A0A386ZAP6_9NOCA|nr:DoxX family protein [Nocardia yunnanensis]AYF74337.1 DoxX family protein [Nocardia yunnanensis]
MTATLTADTRETTASGVAGADIGLLVARVGFGGLLAVHGSQKLFGWFNGYGLDATAHAFQGMGYDPGKFFATLAGLSELTGGLLLALGLLTPLGAAIALGTMINAINATRGNGFAMWELPAVYALASVAFAFTGPGRLALDHGRPWQRQGVVWGAAAVAVGVVAALVTLAVK